MLSEPKKKLSYNQEPEEMWAYMELLLGDTTRYTYEAYKRDNQQELQNLIELAVNPYNFTGVIKKLILGDEPHKGGTYF